MADKLKIAVYWASACGGCDVSITHLHEGLLDLVAAADVVFWPCAMDFKYDDIIKMADGEIDVCLFNGAIRSSDHLEQAELLRKKSKVLVAFGACSAFGGIPGLANITKASELFDVAYLEALTNDNPEKIIPKIETDMPEGKLTLPVTWDTVQSLGQAVTVDYILPGCPPTPQLVAAAVDAIVSGNLPPVGSTIAGTKALCSECGREKKNKMTVKEFTQPWLVEMDPDRCLIEQGIVCMGPATRSGCGAQCLNVNMPCRGCFGPPEGVHDQGAAMLAAIASVVEPPEGKSVKDLLASLQDPLGTFYRFTLPESTLRRSKV